MGAKLKTIKDFLKEQANPLSMTTPAPRTFTKDEERYVVLVRRVFAGYASDEDYHDAMRLLHSGKVREDVIESHPLHPKLENPNK